MDANALIVSFAALTGLLALCAPLVRASRLPPATVQFLVGAAAVWIFVSLGGDTGLRYQSFHDLVFMLFVPILVFEAAQSFHWRELRSQLLPIALMASVGLLITTALVGAAVYWGIGYPQAFPLVAALLTGVLVSATDPAAVTSQPAGIGSRRTRLLLEGESLFNDAVAVSVFSVVLVLALADVSGERPSGLAGSAVWLFVREFGGGLALGALLGVIGRWLLRRFAGVPFAYWVTLALALGGYHLGQWLHVSGVMVCLASGLAVSAAARPGDPVWSTLGQTASGMLFLLMGATVTASMFIHRWLAMLIAIAAVFVARLLSTWLVLAAARGTGRIGWRERTGLGLLGMRGAITLALALVLPTELPYWWTIQSIAYGVVMFDLLITAPLAPYIIRKFS